MMNPIDPSTRLPIKKAEGFYPKSPSLSFAQRSSFSDAGASEKNCFSTVIEKLSKFVTCCWRWVVSLFCCSGPVVPVAPSGSFFIHKDGRWLAETCRADEPFPKKGFIVLVEFLIVNGLSEFRLDKSKRYQAVFTFDLYNGSALQSSFSHATFIENGGVPQEIVASADALLNRPGSRLFGSIRLTDPNDPSQPEVTFNG
jgi:hypothetical protein